jgi:hypothetical protein
LAAEVVDPLLRGNYPEGEARNCVEIGLLCVQENPADRPDASTVALMLSSPTSTSDDDRRAPSRPAFVFGSGLNTASDPTIITGVWSSDGVLLGHKEASTATVSENEMSITELEPR